MTEESSLLFYSLIILGAKCGIPGVGVSIFGSSFYELFSYVRLLGFLYKAMLVMERLVSSFSSPESSNFV